MTTGQSKYRENYYTTKSCIFGSQCICSVKFEKEVIIFRVHKDGKGLMTQIKLFIINFEILTKHIHDKQKIQILHEMPYQ